MILCHKCSGLLAYDKKADTTGLLHCGCISSYVRGLVSVMDRKAVLQAQIDAQTAVIALYQRQQRSMAMIEPEVRLRAGLESLLAEMA